MSKSKPKSPIADPLLKAIADSGMNRLQLAKATGVSRQSIIRFTRGDSTIRVDIAERIAEYFGLELMPKQKSKGKK